MIQEFQQLERVCDDPDRAACLQLVHQPKNPQPALMGIMPARWAVVMSMDESPRVDHLFRSYVELRGDPQALAGMGLQRKALTIAKNHPERPAQQRFVDALFR